MASVSCGIVWLNSGNHISIFVVKARVLKMDSLLYLTLTRPTQQHRRDWFVSTICPGGAADARASGKRKTAFGRVGGLRDVMASALAGSAQAGDAERRGSGGGQILLAPHPQDYARRLVSDRVTAWELAVGPRRAAAGDPGAFDEAVDFLMGQPPLPPLQASTTPWPPPRSSTLRRKAAGRLVGHDSADGERSDARLRRHGMRADISAENIAYGPPTPADVVRELIIDPGVPDRGDPRNIFHPELDGRGRQLRAPTRSMP